MRDSRPPPWGDTRFSLVKTERLRLRRLRFEFNIVVEVEVAVAQYFRWDSVYIFRVLGTGGRGLEKRAGAQAAISRFSPALETAER